MEPIRLLRGQPVAARILDDVTRRAHALVARGVTPGLALVSIGDDPASKIYLAKKKSQAERCGIDVVALAYPAETPHARVFDALAKLATDPRVHGVLVQMPLPAGWPAQDVLLAVPPAKDVDGFHPENLGRLALGLPGFVACTPLGILRLLRDAEIPLAGRAGHRRRPQLDRRHADGAPALAQGRRRHRDRRPLADSRSRRGRAARPTCSSSAMGVPLAIGAST